MLLAIVMLSAQVDAKKSEATATTTKNTPKKTTKSAAATGSSSDVDAAAKAKAKATAAKAKAKAKAKAEAEAAAAAAAEAEEDDWDTTTTNKGKRRDLKDWSKITDKDFEKLEDNWMADEEEDPEDESFKWQRGPNGERRPPERKGPKTEMGFVELTAGTTKPQTEELAKQWQKLMHTGAVPVKAFAIEDNKVLFVVEGGFQDMFRVKQFCLDQPQVVEFEWNQKKYPRVPGQKQDEVPEMPTMPNLANIPGLENFQQEL
jgi:hypothetical protein